MLEQDKIESIISETLIGDTRKNLLDLVAFLRANELPPKWDGDWWCIDYNCKNLVLLGINTGGIKFGILFSECDFGSNDLKDDDLKETVWNHVQICEYFKSGGKNCGCDEQPGLITICGKDFNACKSPLTFVEPDAKTLENIKKLILLLKSNADMKHT